MAREKILIAVKTYPVISEKYKELACTAGFRQDGSWIRLYPIPFRLLEKDKRYKKYQWIEADTSRNKRDPRPESYHVSNTDGIQLLNEVGTDREWEERRKLILDNKKIYTNLKEIIVLAHSNSLSLVIFKPTSILDFVVEDTEPEWPQEKINMILNSLRQRDLFKDQNFEDFKVMPKLPKKIFIDSKMMKE